MFKLDWLKLLEPPARRTWEAILTLFERHPIRIAAAAALVLSAVVTGNFYVARTKQYQDIVSTTVRAETEDTPQRFKVLEAFIMSTIDHELSAGIQNATISREFTSRLDELHRILASTDPAGGTADEEQPVATYLSIPDYVDSVNALPSQNAILTDAAEEGYLFFPLNLLRTRWEARYTEIFAESRKAANSPTLTAAIAQDSAIVDDINVSRRLLPVMKEFTRTVLFDSPTNRAAEVRPVQIYYITKNGLNRIVNNTEPDEQKVVYRNMFRATTFFPSRPYYVEAFRRIAPDHLENVSGRVADAFYVSQPYLDIGGFGVVVTLARPVRYADHSDAAICFDLRVRLQNDVSFRLKERLASFGATPQEMACQVGFRGEIECEPGEGADVEFGLQRMLEERLNATMIAGDLSTVVGNISILSDAPSRVEDVSQASALDFLTYPTEALFGYNTRPITFAIPLTSPRALRDQRGLEALFVISSLNLERFQQVTSLLGLVSVTLLGTAFVLVLLSWQGEMRTRQTFESAFKTVDKVLYGAPTPYCRLDARDEIVDCNTAFCDLLKMPGDLQSVESLKGVTFESLIAPRSKATYHDVQERRRAGQEVPPYTLYFLRKDNTEVETRVTSGVIPGRTRRELPETFGIVISSPNVPA